jgi:hypothetical protein
MLKWCSSEAKTEALMEKGILFCLGSWASAGSQPKFQSMRRAVVILLRNILLRIAAVQNVVANPSDGSSCGSWHSTMLPQKPVRSRQTVTKKKNVPFSHTLF